MYMPRFNADVQRQKPKREAQCNRPHPILLDGGGSPL
jgi:hypothetical protein